MADLRTDYKDDVLNINTNERRKYRMINNADGTISFEDVTDYVQQGDTFGATEVNQITEKVNSCLTRQDVVDNAESTATDLPSSANIVRELNEELNIIGKGSILGVKLYAGHWIYDGNVGKPLLFVPLPCFNLNYDVTVSYITVQGGSQYSSDITISRYHNAICFSHPSVTGTTNNGKFGVAAITFSEKSV